jgi:CHAT domain-containing protein
MGRRVRRFREKLQEGEENFREDAMQLYEWLIRPAEKELKAHGVETLVIAPDGPLRLLPFAALHDGNRYLVEDYAMSTLLALGLTDLRAGDAQTKQILLNGLSQSRENFSALPHVKTELESLRKIFDGDILMDERFTLVNLKTELGNHRFDYVHMATHAKFGGSFEESFLLTYDGKLTLDQLDQLLYAEKYQGKPPELLTLSACETALGDERSAFGLAGVALKSGAKSVMATLWETDDRATFMTIDAFYRQLAENKDMTKVQALRKSQQKLLAGTRYTHPMFWAQFVIIGNWM